MPLRPPSPAARFQKDSARVGASANGNHRRAARPGRPWTKSHRIGTVAFHTRANFRATLKTGGSGPKAPWGKKLRGCRVAAGGVESARVSQARGDAGDRAEERPAHRLALVVRRRRVAVAAEQLDLDR